MPHWESTYKIVHLEHVYRVLEIMSGSYFDYQAAIAVRAREVDRTEATIRDGITRGLYGEENGGIARFVAEYTEGTLLDTIRRRFSLSLNDLSHFAKLLPTDRTGGHR